MRTNLLTVLVEDYFQVDAFGNLIQERNWSRFETRYQTNTLRVLDLLDSLNTKATFFILGWIAKQSPEIVREIASRGHEIASRGFYHRPLRCLSPEEFREDLRNTNLALEDASGQKIVGYRAAEKLDYVRDRWIFEILAEENFIYDASFLPKRRTEQRFAHRISVNDREIWEFPYSTKDFRFKLLPISGGNYFRQIPYTLMRFFVRNWIENEKAPFVFYFHVWELDQNQPRISAANFYNRIRHYRKLDKMEWIIRENLTKYRFCSISEYLGLDKNLKIPAEKAEFKREEINLSTETLTPITIIVPCYNEADTLGFLSKTLAGLEIELNTNSYQPQFIFVDDASTDQTLEKLESLFASKQNVRILRHERNLGVAASIMTGLRAAQTEIVCSIDCDCSYDPHNLLKMIPLLDEETHIVTASPYHRNGSVRNVPSWRLFLSKSASWLYQKTLGSKISTYTSCFRVYRRSKVASLSLEETGFLGVAEMLGKILIDGGKVVEYPTTLEVRLFGFSKMKTLKTIFGHVRLLTSLALSRFLGKARSFKLSRS